MQSALVSHVAGQVASWPLQAYGAQGPVFPPVPCGAIVHVPSIPATSQRSHSVPQVRSQQTPFAQTPFAHSGPAVHVVPGISRGTQRPPLQNALLSHEASEVQTVGQPGPEPSQVNGAHAGTLGCWMFEHVPFFAAPRSTEHA
jgi:hypothetical protein